MRTRVAMGVGTKAELERIACVEWHKGDTLGLGHTVDAVGGYFD